MVHGFWGKRMPLCGRNSPDSILRTVSSTRCLELFSLLVSDGGPQVLDLNRALTDEDDLSHFLDSGHPGIANQLRIQGRNAGRLLRIAGGAGLPFQHAGVPSSSPTPST